jgi:hypothetical protein
VHREALAFHHHLDEVLADIVKIAFDRADDDAASRLYSGGDEVGLEGHQARVHGPSGDEDLRDVDLVSLELTAYDAHAGHEAAFEDVFRSYALVQSLLDGVSSLVGPSLLEKGGNIV